MDELLTEVTITLGDIEKMAGQLAPFLYRTRLEKRTLIHADGNPCDIWIKREDLQRTNSFTSRAAFGIIAGLSRKQLEQGLVFTTPGNLGWGVLYALDKLAISPKVTIVIPEDAVDSKVSGLETLQRTGVNIVRRGLGEAERYKIVEEIALQEGKLPLDIENRNHEVAAKATVALECYQQLLEIQPNMTNKSYTFICPVGSGALLTGCAIALKALLGQRVKIIGVEPQVANDFSRLFGKQEDIKSKSFDEVTTIADSLRSPSVRPEYRTQLLDLVDDIIEVTESEITQSMKELYKNYSICSEPSAAVSFAASKKISSKELRETEAICLVTAGNVDKHQFDFYK